MNGIRAQAGRLAIVATIALALAACGKSGGSGAGGGSTGAAESGAGGGGSSGVAVRAGNAGSLGSVLIDSRGFTLYHLEGETTSNFKCTGSCVATWPPLAAAGTPKEGAGATGQIAAVQRPDGTMQVTYDGLPLYTFSGDAAPGDTNGEGVQGVWFAVTPAGQSAKSGGGAGASPTGGGGGYGGY
jgi:predicted lipoprotein with Yx(FWY)xxD motif